MKQNIISIAKPCSEKWEKMTPNKKGHFCDSCSKTVIDFTHSSQEEIKRHLKVNKSGTCGRIRQSQLEQPFATHKKTYQFKLPYKNIAAGLLITSSLSLTTSCETKSNQVTSIISKTTASETVINLKSNSKVNFTQQIIDSTIIIKGQIITPWNSLPLPNAKVSFISLNEIITTKSKQDGSFTLEIPNYLINSKNVIRFPYQKIKEVPNITDLTSQVHSPFLINKDYVINEKQIKKTLIITVEQDEMILGEVLDYFEESNTPPIVINEGKEVKYKDFIKAQEGKKSSCNIENKEFYYFDGDAAIALYGEKAKNGLYLYLPQ